MDSPQKPATLCHTKVCSDIVNGVDCGDDVANWISEALEVSYLRLIRQSESDKRMQRKKKEEEKKLLSLSNQAQFLLINRTTVKWLRDQIKDPTFTDDLDQLTNRFRGNLMIDTEHALVEREWERLIIGKHEFKVRKTMTAMKFYIVINYTSSMIYFSRLKDFVLAVIWFVLTNKLEKKLLNP